MPEIAVLVKVQIAPVDLPNLKEYRLKNMKALKRAVPGFQSLTIWQSETDAKQHTILINYHDEAAAEAGLQVSLDHGALVESLKNPNNVPEVRRGTISHSMGKRFQDSPVGSLASMSFRVAEPGRGDSLEDELAEIFQELTVIDGYLGSMTCRNEALDEEVIGIVFWTDRPAYESSLPAKLPYEVGLFHRTF